MKTINTDLGAFLKRNAGEIRVRHDGKMFVVKYYDMTFSSQYLDDALENLAEDRRRCVNRIQPVREKLSEPQPAPATTTSSTTPAYVPPFQASPSISQAAQQAYQQQAAAQYPTCPNCGAYPRYWSSTDAGCGMNHLWSIRAVVGSRVRGDSVAGNDVWEYDGKKWNQVTP